MKWRESSMPRADAWSVMNTEWSESG
jgi:hypothetical protein